MSDQEPIFDPYVLEAVKKARDLPSVPAVAMEVLHVAQNDRASAKDLASVVSLDPALAAKILKVANSALFGGRSQITTLQLACARLGFETVKLWALSFAMVDSLDRPEVEEFDYEEYWKRSLVRAVSASLLAEAVAPKLAEEAFITGLLSRIGQLVLASYLPGEYRAVLATSAESWPSQELQKKTLGFSSDELGAALLYTWNLPPQVYEAVRWGQSEPDEISEDVPATTKTLAQILNLAASCEELVFDAGKSKALTKLHDTAKGCFDLDAEAVERLLTQVDQRTTEIAEVLRIKINGGLEMPEILRSAQLELLRNTITVLHQAIVSEQRATQLQFENSLLLMRARIDPVTGLADRDTFRDALASCAEPESDGNYHLQAGFLKITVDNFRKITSGYDPPIEERVLQLISRVVQEVIGESDLAARYGDEEFVVVMPRITADQLPEIGEKIRSEIEKRRLKTDTGQVALTVSVGGSHTEIFDSPFSPEHLIDLAERHTNRANQRGGNQCDFATGRVDLNTIGN